MRRYKSIGIELVDYWELDAKFMYWLPSCTAYSLCRNHIKAIKSGRISLTHANGVQVYIVPPFNPIRYVHFPQYFRFVFHKQYVTNDVMQFIVKLRGENFAKINFTLRVGVKLLFFNANAFMHRSMFSINIDRCIRPTSLQHIIRLTICFIPVKF